ncbi:MAG TPA: sigma-70 family RNA polymerase sigma factor [Gemmatimonadales bacterium]|jgi:RNA polymerase sigma factor (sigma-70 family)
MDPDEVATLFRSCAPELRDDFQRRFPWSHDVVEDAIQHAFLQLHLAKHPPDQPRAWLRTVTHHHIIDRLRADGKLVRDDDIFADVAAAEPSAVTGQAVSTTLVQRALGLLTTRARRMLRGKYLDAKSYRTLAREEGLATSGIGRVLDRARQRLRRAVDEMRKGDSLGK